ncbi:hypothetical protein V493_00109 [Pseudogymnoascus sp. VKM F-4281 (FW-2241)]|nr:hypothetical protein V493_00109 [Pseudogymnoascus sp. VKM F-4281 (FW-2241)]
MSVVSSKGKSPTTPTSSQKTAPLDDEMPDALAVNELRETLRVKLPDTYSGNRKDLEVFLLQVELYQYFNDDKFPTAERLTIDYTSSRRRNGLTMGPRRVTSIETTRVARGTTTLATTDGRTPWNSMPPSSKEIGPATPTRNDSSRNGYALIATSPATWPGTANSQRRATEDASSGIKGDSTLEEESSDEESEAESFTASKQETFDELAPKEHAHNKIREAKKEPNSQRRVPTLKGIYGNLLEGLLLECLVDDCKEDLWRYYNVLTNEHRRLGTLEEIETFLVQEAKELRKDVEHMATLKSMKGVELWYQDRRRALKEYDEKVKDMIRRENTKPATRLERRAMEQLNTFPTPPKEDSEWAKGQQELTMSDATETDHP